MAYLLTIKDFKDGVMESSITTIQKTESECKEIIKLRKMMKRGYTFETEIRKMI